MPSAISPDRLGKMRFLRFPIEKMLKVHLARHPRVSNVDRTGFDLPPTVPKIRGETSLARVRTTDGRVVIFSNVRVVTGEGEFLEYDDIARCHYMSDSIPTEYAEIQRMKVEHFDRLILVRGDGSKLVLDHLDQAAFPLERFLQWVLLKAEAERLGLF